MARMKRGFLALSAGLLFVSACRKESPPPVKIVPVFESSAPAVTFRDATAEAGIAFTHINGAAGKKWMPETMGGGVAVLDYDNDGREDLLFVSSSFWPGDPRAGGQKTSLVLYRNEGNGPD